MIELRDTRNAAMNKFFLPFALLVVCACPVSSCGGKSGQKSDTERQQPVARGFECRTTAARQPNERLYLGTLDTPDEAFCIWTAVSVD